MWHSTGNIYYDDGVSLDQTINHVSAAFRLSRGQLTSVSTLAGSMTIPILSTVQLLGMTSSPRTVTINGQGWTSYTFNSGSSLVTITGMNVDLRQTMTITWT
jgi:hypothetical protein